MELSLKEVEVTKLNLQPGDTLVVVVKSDRIDEMDGRELGKGFKQKFPDNEVVVLGVFENEDVKFQILAQKPVDLSCANSPVGYCSDCNCGKREQIEGAK
jgi:hypothetical protein